MKFTEIKQRLDPKCWTGKKIGNPKTKVKGGVRVNNCVPAESVEEDLTRRGFLKGAGAAAVAGAGLAAAGNAKADDQEINKWVNYATNLAIESMGWMKRDTQYELRTWLVENVSKWVADYCRYTNSYNAKEVIDYCNQQGAVAAGVDKQNSLEKIFSNNLKERYQNFLNAYKDGIKESYLKFNNAKQQTQNQRRSPSPSYASIIGNLIKSRIAFNANIQGNPVAEVEIRCAPDGTIVARKLTKPSGNTEWDNAVLTAIEKTEQIPRDIDGRVYSPIIISFSPKDAQQVDPDLEQKRREQMKRMANMESVEQGVAEDYNAEYDDEAGMADNNLSTLRRAVDGLDDLIDSGDNLPEWCQEKIAVAKSMLVAVWDYMESADDAEEEDPEVVEMYEALEQLAEELAQRTNKDVEQVWETLEALDDQKLYETAAWRRKEGKSKTGGLNAKGVASYRRENPGSKLQTAVTTKPSKLKPGSKAAKRRKSFCARMSGVKGPMKKPNGKPTRKALALRKWNC